MTQLQFEILAQPNDTTCGPTSLQAVYNYYGDAIGLNQVIGEVTMIEGGGTKAVLLGHHALSRGYSAKLYTFDMQVFDPTWFALPADEMADRLRCQLEIKRSPQMEVLTEAYLKFLELGGKILLADITVELIRGFLKREMPILTGLSSTYLYRSAREIDQGDRLFYDDIRGEPAGHFVVLYGYDAPTRTARLADPLNPNPMSLHQHYEVKLNRLIPAIMLGTVTFDANMLIIAPQKSQKERIR